MRRLTAILQPIDGNIKLLSRIRGTCQTQRRLLGSSILGRSQPPTILDKNEIDSVEGSKPVTKSFIDEIKERQRKLPLPQDFESPRTSMPSTKNGSLPSILLGATSGKEFVHSTIPLKTFSSLFDVFPVPEPPPLVVSKTRSPNAFPEEAVTQYWEVLEPLMQSDNKFLKKHTASPIPETLSQPVMDWLRSDEPALVYDLPSFQAALKGGMHNTRGASRQIFQAELAEQNARFCKHLNLNVKQLKLIMTGLKFLTSRCAKHGKGLPVEVIWEKIKESGMFSKELLHSLLYVSATFSTGSVRSRRKRRSKYGHLAGIASILDVLDVNGPPDEPNTEDSESDLVDLTDEIAIFHDLLFEPTEQSINVRVKLLVAQGNAMEAEKLLDEHSKGEADLRLRAYTPVLRLFLELNDVSSALVLFHKMRNMPTVHVDVETFIHLIAGFAEKGRFRVGAEPIASALELGYKNASGPKLFDELVQEMAEAFFEIPESATKRLYNALASGMPDSGLTESAVHALQLTQKQASDNELVASRVRIDPTIGSCPRTGVKLRLIHLQDNEKEKLVEQVLKMSRTEQSRSFNKRSSDDHLFHFYTWLDQREGRPFTVFVDGANVAYYHQNFEDGRFCYHQIKFMVDYLERLGENPLVILPYKYSWNNFKVSQGAPGSYQRDKQVLTKAEIMIRDSLIRFGKLFFVSGGFLDDFYWIVSSVSSQTNSRKFRDLTVLPGNIRGQWPGTRPVLITNDQMRDHQTDLLDPFLFRRWYSNYIVNYNFAAFTEGVCTHPDIGFSPADFFSREIQSTTDPNGSTIWHFPITNKDDEWFCCRIPAKKGDEAPT